MNKYHSLQHFGLGMLCFAYLTHFFGLGVGSLLSAGIFFGIEAAQFLLRRGSFLFTKDTMTDLLADVLGYGAGLGVWYLL